MKNDEHKKTALLRVLQIIEQYTDENHVLTHSEITEILEKKYNIKVERKAVGRYIAILNEVGYEISTTKKGSYLMNRKFEDSELKLLIDGVLSSRYINPTHSKQLIEKLSSLSTEYFKPRIENVCSVSEWSKSDNAALFYNIDVIDEAISQKKKIKFSYNKYGADKKLHYVAIHIVDNCKTISKRTNCFLDLVNTYNAVLTEHKTAINLYAFLTNAVLWNRCINELKTYAQQDDENFRQGTKTIDGITYSMVNKYRKLCCGYEESLIQELNAVMDDASLRLHGKRYLNNLHYSKEKETSQNTVVKLFTMEIQANNRKKMIVGALIAVALIAVVTLIIILCK